ncbi:MAG: DNA polymerase Y family protein, partial [Candidatus Hydrogenedentes bacterium]|nr:DNA polymerase Y family protein [Candidatus Hydrogenedentota bacterium]
MPLQILLQRHPEWRALPAVVLDRDKSTGVVLWGNEHAQARRIRPGMPYAAALSLARRLRSGTVADAEIERAVAAITQRLCNFSPRVEPSTRERGVFWLDASGMRHLYPSLEAWAACLHDDLRDARFLAVVAVGFTRFGSYGAAKANSQSIVFHTPTEEQSHLRHIGIQRLELAPALRDVLLRLGIDTLGDFIDLPASGIRRRFGAEAAELHALA